jgi:DNA-binding transcriptional ArsR family regulator
MQEHPLPQPVVELVAQRFRALGDPLRIRLLERLMEGEASVRELVSATGAGQQNVSKHLGVLLHARVVDRRKQGTLVFYRIIDDVVYSLCEQVCASLERQHAQLGELFASSGAGVDLVRGGHGVYPGS